MSEFNPLLAKVFLLFVILLGINGFNIDFTHPIIVTDKSEGKTYFGFTTALLTNPAGSWVLVGAPRANSSSEFSQAVREPGVVHFCSITTKQCDQINFQNKPVETEIRPEYKYIERRTNGWLGGSLDVADTHKPNVVACAHLWKNQYNPNNWLTNGMCFTIDYELNLNSVRRLLPMTRSSKQYIDNETYVYAFGMAGFSSHFIEGTEDLILGAPGVYNWKGTFVYTQQSEYNRPKINQQYSIPLLNTKLHRDSYLGYSVSSGVFFNENEIQLVAGAPRDGIAGSVFITEIPTLYDTELIVRMKKEGAQMGEYFGASVCAVDINGDHLSDLLVGAPLHSNQVEEGLVYVYLNNPDGSLSPAKNNLIGSSVPNARFGTSISNIGDLDKDGFNDVAIGAPYEGNGAVYIYRGSENGLIDSQKLLASDIDRKLRGFGISISKGMDIDQNSYSDIAIGAHDSSHSVVLRSFPVAKIQGSIEFNISKVNLNTHSCQFLLLSTTCFTLSACVLYSGENVPDELVVRNTLSVGTPQRRENRAFFIENTLATEELEYDTLLKRDSPNCREIQTHVWGSTVDILTPLFFSLKTDIARNPSKEELFCEECPVLAPDSTNVVNEALPFSINCGADEMCEADLSIDAHIRELIDAKSFILGSSKTVTLVAEITNKGEEPAYLSKAVILLPPKTQLKRLDSLCFEHKANSVVEIICDLGNPLNSSSKITLEVVVDVNDLKIPIESLTFSINASTTSNDVNLHDNSLDLLIPVETDIDMALIGSTNDEQVLLSKKAGEGDPANDSTVIYHVFQVIKNGPTPVESVTLEMRIPTAQSENNFAEIVSAIPTLDGELSHFGSCTGDVPLLLMQSNDFSNTTGSATTQQPIARYIIKNVRDTENYQNLDCITKSCKVIRCRLGPFKDQELATVTIAIDVSLSTFQSIIEDKGAIRFITWGRVTVNDQGLDQFSSYSHYAEITTEFVKEGFTKSKQLDNWIIPVCVIVGILILLLIAFVLYKTGFFRREKKEEMEKEKRTSSDGKNDNNLLDRNGEATDSTATTETA